MRLNIFLSISLWLCLYVKSSSGDVNSRQPKGANNIVLQGKDEGHLPYIYPRIGRLFHADAVRDNEIFRSLGRTKFMNRWPPFMGDARRRIPRELHKFKFPKKVYPSESSVWELVSGTQSFNHKGYVEKTFASQNKVNQPQRSRRDINSQELSGKDQRLDTENVKGENKVVSKSVEHSSNKSPVDSVATNNNSLNQSETLITERNRNKIKDNDTATPSRHYKPKQELKNTSEEHKPLFDEERTKVMRNSLFLNRLKLYPVYRGVKTEERAVLPQQFSSLTSSSDRRLLYSPQLTVSMDIPVVSEYIPRKQNITSDETEVEGRSRRLKKLALPLLLALKLKSAIMLPLLFGLVSLTALKGLWAGFTALGIAAALGLKALVVGSSKVFYEIRTPQPQPHHYHYPPHEYEYWSRRQDDPYKYKSTGWS